MDATNNRFYREPEAKMTDAKNDQGYTIDPQLIPMNMRIKAGIDGEGEDEWLRIPSWRIEFGGDALDGLDIRIHHAVGKGFAWTISEASTGMKLYDGWGDHEDMDELADLFCQLMLPKLTSEQMAKSLKRSTDNVAAMPAIPNSPYAK